MMFHLARFKGRVSHPAQSKKHSYFLGGLYANLFRKGQAYSIYVEQFVAQVLISSNHCEQKINYQAAATSRMDVSNQLQHYQGWTRIFQMGLIQGTNLQGRDVLHYVKYAGISGHAPQELFKLHFKRHFHIAKCFYSAFLLIHYPKNQVRKHMLMERFQTTT